MLDKRIYNWPEDKLKLFNAHPMINKNSSSVFDSFFDEKRWETLYNVPVGGDQYGFELHYQDRLGAFIDSMHYHKTDCSDAWFKKIMGFLDEYEEKYQEIAKK